MIERRRARSVRRSDALAEQRHRHTSGPIKCHARTMVRGSESPHLSTRLYSRIVASWVASIEVDPYGTHSLRRTRAPLIYRRARNLRAVQLLIGHAKLNSTVRCLGTSGFRDVIDSVLEGRRSGFKLGLHCGNAVRTSRGAYPLTDRGSGKVSFQAKRVTA